MQATLLIALGLILLCPATHADDSQSIQQIKIAIHQQARVGNLTLEFVSVVQDSRCPVNEQCIWAGNAKVRLKVKSCGEPWSSIELNTATPPTRIIHDDQEIRLIDLLPTPATGAAPDASSYVAVLSIGRRTEPKEEMHPPIGPPEKS